MAREMGAVPHELMVDAIMGSTALISPTVAKALVKNGLARIEERQETYAIIWQRPALEEISTDLLTDLYLSLKNAKVPNVLS